MLVGVVCCGDDVLEGFEDGRCGLGGCTDDGEVASEFINEDDLMSMEARRGLREELWIEAEDTTDGGGRGGNGWRMRGVTMLAGGAVGAGAAELAIEREVGAGESAKRELPGREVEAEATVGGVVEVYVERLGCVGAGALLCIDMGDGECGCECGGVVVGVR